MNNLLLKDRAIRLTHSNVVAVDLGNWDSFDVNNNIVNTDDVLVREKLNELQAAEPMRLLRIERNQLLAQTDWRMTTDYPYTDQDQWASYRTSLRNLPATAEPTLDEQGNLIVDWPTPPDAV